jgi:hypothetical protein
MAKAKCGARKILRNWVLKDYGYMAIMDYLDSHDANNILEFGHGFNAALLERYGKARNVWGVDETIRVSPTSIRPTAMRGKNVRSRSQI